MAFRTAFSFSSSLTGTPPLAAVCNFTSFSSASSKGISPESLPKIFKPFFTTRKEGTGLGLSLAKGIVQSHGGEIEATSTLGKGTQFRIQLPIERPKNKLARSAGPSAG